MHFVLFRFVHFVRFSFDSFSISFCVRACVCVLSPSLFRYTRMQDSLWLDVVVFLLPFSILFVDRERVRFYFIPVGYTVCLQ